MSYIVAYAMSVLAACFVMIWALIIRALRVGPNGRLNSDEVFFILCATVAMFVPALNMVVALCYLVRALKG